MIAEAFQRADLPISAEVEEKLRTYEALLRKWQKTINLVGPSTLDNVVERHFLESAQLLRYIKGDSLCIIDMGSGAGFPGMVLSIMGMKNVHLIESDTRKSVFLQNVSRETFSPVTIHNRRVEACDIPRADVVTARALAPVKDLLDMMSKFVSHRSTYGLFLKGARVQDEIADAHKHWDFSAEIHEGLGKILKISALTSKRCGT